MKHRTPDRSACFFPHERTIRNPHKGFCTFQRSRFDALNSAQWVPRVWEHIIPEPEKLGRDTSGNFPDTTIAYFRIPWAFLEPEEGRYDFSYLDRMIARSAALGQHTMLRFPPHINLPDDHDLPLWFQRKLGLPPREEGDKASPRDERFFEDYSRFVRAVGAHINKDPRIEGVDISVTDGWGEDAGIDMLPRAWWSRVIDAYTESMTTFPLVKQFNHTESVFYANEKRPVGLRLDCLGNMIIDDPAAHTHMFWHYPDAFAEMPRVWERAPIHFEVCWSMTHWYDKGWDIDYTIEQSLKWHITSFNAKSSPVPEPWREKTEAWIRHMGYRFAIRRADYPSYLETGDTASVTLWVENRGVAPIYHKHPFRLRLVGEGGVYLFDTDVDITAWLPGDSMPTVSFRIGEEIPAGTYYPEVGICDGDTIVHFATEAPESEDGFLRIGGPIRVAKGK